MEPNELVNLIEFIKTEISLEFIRISGAGGQNVNKVASKVVLRWNLLSSGIDSAIKEVLCNALRARLSKDGDIIITSQEFREQISNRRKAIDKFEKLLKAAFEIRKPRKPTRPTRASKFRRLDSKRQQKIKKQSRGKIYE